MQQWDLRDGLFQYNVQTYTVVIFIGQKNWQHKC